MKDIYIVGAGGFAREVAWLIEDINENKNTWNIKGYIDENVENIGKELNGYKVLGDMAYLNSQSKADVVIAIGTGSIREKIVKKISNHNYPILIHPQIKISKHIEIGKGTIICYGNSISVNVKLGEFNVINTGSIIGHDCRFEDYISIMANVTVSGNVEIGKNSTIGSGSVILQKKKIEENAIVGIGSAVIKKVKKNNTAIGVPAKNYKLGGE